MSPTPQAIGVDVGGTKLVACTLDGSGQVVDRARTRSPVGDPDALLDAIAGIARDVGDDLPIGIGVPGPVNHAGVIDFAPNLRVEDLDVAGGIADRLGRRPTVTNDASAALVAEQRLGGAVGHDHVVMITVGTGVGGAVVVDGRLLTGVNGYAGELGHLLADPAGPACGCGSVGCLEAMASGSAMTTRAQAIVAAGETSTVLATTANIDGHALDDAAAGGDPVAIRVRAEAAAHLGRAAGSLVNVFDPSLVLLGGGAGVNAADDLIPIMQEVMRVRITGRHRPVPPIAVATLGDDAGMIGAALLAIPRAEAS